MLGVLWQAASARRECEVAQRQRGELSNRLAVAMQENHAALAEKCLVSERLEAVVGEASTAQFLSAAMEGEAASQRAAARAMQEHVQKLQARCPVPLIFASKTSWLPSDGCVRCIVCQLRRVTSSTPLQM